MLDTWDSFWQRGVDFVEDTLGLDVVYLTTFIFIILSIMVINKINKYGWDELDRSEKSLIKSIFFTTSVTIVASILHFCGFF